MRLRRSRRGSWSFGSTKTSVAPASPVDAKSPFAREAGNLLSSRGGMESLNTPQLDPPPTRAKCPSIMSARFNRPNSKGLHSSWSSLNQALGTVATPFGTVETKRFSARPIRLTGQRCRHVMHQRQLPAAWNPVDLKDHPLVSHHVRGVTQWVTLTPVAMPSLDRAIEDSSGDSVERIERDTSMRTEPNRQTHGNSHKRFARLIWFPAEDTIFLSTH